METEIKNKLKIIDAFIVVMKAQIDFYNLTCEPGYELTVEQVLEYLSKVQKK